MWTRKQYRDITYDICIAMSGKSSENCRGIDDVKEMLQKKMKNEIEKKIEKCNAKSALK